MKLLEVINPKKAKFKRGLNKSRSLRSTKDKQFEKPELKSASEVQG